MQQYQAMREALELEEQQALRCVAQEESRVLGSIEEKLSSLNYGLRTIQSTFHSMQSLADEQGALRAQDQAFIMVRLAAGAFGKFLIENFLEECLK